MAEDHNKSPVGPDTFFLRLPLGYVHQWAFRNLPGLCDLSHGFCTFLSASSIDARVKCTASTLKKPLSNGHFSACGDSLISEQVPLTCIRTYSLYDSRWRETCGKSLRSQSLTPVDFQFSANFSFIIQPKNNYITHRIPA